MTPTARKLAPIVALLLLSGCPFAHAQGGPLFDRGPALTTAEMNERLHGVVGELNEERESLIAEVDSLKSQLAEANGPSDWGWFRTAARYVLVGIFGALICYVAVKAAVAAAIGRGLVWALLFALITSPAYAQSDPSRGPLAPHDAVSGFLRQVDGEYETPELTHAELHEPADAAVQDGGEAVTDAAPEGVTFRGEGVEVYSGSDPDAAPEVPTIEVPERTPVGEPLIATLNFTPPADARVKITWEPSEFGTFDLGDNRLGIWAKAGKYSIGARVVLVTADEIYDWNPKATFVVGDPPPPKPLAELVSKEQAAELVTRYQAVLVLKPDSAEKFYAAHADILAALELGGSEYEARVLADFKAAGDDAAALLAELEKTIKALGAAPIPPTPPKPDGLGALVPDPAHRALLAEFYGDFAAVVRSGVGGTVAEFYAAQRKAVDEAQATGKLPKNLSAINKPISDRITAALGGTQDAPLDATKRTALANALDAIAGEFK